MSDFHNQRTSTARKSHICILCGQEIPVGEKYKRSTGKWCGLLIGYTTGYMTNAVEVARKQIIVNKMYSDAVKF